MRRLFLAISIVLSGAASAPADEAVGKAHVVDGNTLRLDGREILLHGISAPALAESCPDRHGQSYPCGVMAARSLQVLLQDKPIRCKILAEAPTRATCFLDRMDLGEQMVQNGYALALRAESAAYVRAEQAARLTRSGVWKIRTFQPSDFKGRGH